jgi:hypothetical protein
MLLMIGPQLNEGAAIPARDPLGPQALVRFDLVIRQHAVATAALANVASRIVAFAVAIRTELLAVLAAPAVGQLPVRPVSGFVHRLARAGACVGPDAITGTMQTELRVVAAVGDDELRLGVLRSDRYTFELAVDTAETAFASVNGADVTRDLAAMSARAEATVARTSRMTIRTPRRSSKL